MRKLAMYFLVLLFAVHAVAVFAQAAKNQTPPFTQTISEWHQGGFPPSYHRLRVIGTNTSNEVIIVGGCEVQRGVYKVSVVYNGVPLEENDAAARRQRETNAKRTMCNHELGINKVSPGGNFERLVYISGNYDMTNPGTYEITVSRETDPDYLEKSVTVKSNTLTIVVPEPGATAPQ
jgi:hypothetical protein